jgi:hypothetical protein
MEETKEIRLSPFMMRYKKDHPVRIISIRARRHSGMKMITRTDSFCDFESEHSSHYHTPELEPSALEFTVEKLFDMIQNGFPGCP